MPGNDLGDLGKGLIGCGCLVMILTVVVPMLFILLAGLAGI